MKLMWKLILIGSVVVVGVWWAGVGQGDAARPAPTIPAARRLLLLPPQQKFHGVAWQIHHAHECVGQAEKILGQIADLGADTVLISNAGYQKHAASASFEIDPEVTPSVEQWQQIFKIAHGNGLRVVLMPIVLLSEPRGNEWRGVIKPPDWDDWFDRYVEFLLHFGRLAADGEVEVLMVGSELISTERDTDRWRNVIRRIRKVYPGLLSYSSNWDHYKVVEFWDELDLIGMTSYYKLSEEPNPRLDDLIKQWQPIKRGLLRWQRKLGKPLLFTEAGWCSQEGASVEPWNYYYSQKPTSSGHEEQRRCYRAFMETWKATPEVGGVIWWEWKDTPGGKDDYNYTPKGKPAERELRTWFDRARRSRAVADGLDPLR